MPLDKNPQTIISNPAYYIAFIIDLLSRQYWKIHNTIKLKWWGVVFGNNNMYRGAISIVREPKSTIVIGSHCSFYNTTTSNRVGLYCPCMFSTKDPGAKIIIGNNCGFSGTRIWAAKNVVIGNNVRCGANTYIADSDAHTDDPRAGEDSDVIIDDNVWLGTDVKVLKGVHIGKNSLIAAGSIVTKDIPDNVVAGGIPCRVIKEIIR